MGGARNKPYLEVAGTPLLSYALRAFERSTLVTSIVIVVRPGEAAAAEHAAELAGCAAPVIVPGGADRQSSEHAGLGALEHEVKTGEVEVIAIHDGARPFVGVPLIDAVVTAASDVGGAVPGLPVREPLYAGAPGSPERAERGLVRMQTPQAFSARPLLAAYEAASQIRSFSAPDTAATVERFSDLAIAVVPGEETNIKITYPRDLELARYLAPGFWPG